MHKSILVFALMGVTLMSGCNNAKSPDSVANDVASAQKKEALTVADARNDAAKSVNSAAEKVDDKAADLNNAQAKGAYDVALAKAEGDRKINLAQCNALAGDDQKRCKDRADADYEAAKANAKARETNQKQ
jgi:hypothetical protein